MRSEPLKNGEPALAALTNGQAHIGLFHRNDYPERRLTVMGGPFPGKPRSMYGFLATNACLCSAAN
jgi:hypothetical protein